MGVLVLHGWQNHRPEGHWERLLAEELAGRGVAVSYPQLPDPDDPDLEVWLGELVRHLDELPGPEKVVVCHSLACTLWLHAAARGLVRADRVLLVAPPSPEFCAGEPEIADFVPPRLSAERVAETGAVRLAASENDPYCAGGALAVYGRPLGLDGDLLPGAGHVDLGAGYGRWPSVLAWCLDPGVRLVPRVSS
ncbi:RBBP9/YdeN family alpha/beta hydrolase [Actinocorallia sp. A-T 12471]|uniref:RBBP9/YdeN family alpha/beta hydrolase n=1 Tax=Actinocorallia sp. A-T 12471 TaxID=3089813 RepID=UPI0029CD53EB|nr:alpha/beta hydrolase [Actinocorallia sp. A-T 12471]MDX6742043.1 alpha/beta hydrolase [Actinocorallia sp. A-T 12471]